ncbi:putative transmembrane protein [Candidatus Paraburkholderia schumanniana]|nr:putative transmembrane protein [Candidatus Paraburkholderia schumannianae]
MSAGFADVDWARPWFAPIEARGRRWQAAALDGYAQYLAALNDAAAAAAHVTGRGKPLAFIAQEALPAGASYEGHIAQTGCVPTRHNLHDFFNGLMWFAYPRIKAALNARQAAQIDALGIGPTRGGMRDALTLFDENAVLFACADPSLADALRGFGWHTLFVDERAAWGTRCEARMFGHALLEKLVAPYKACTAHAWIVDVPADYFAGDDAARCAIIDEAVSARIAAEPLDSRAFAPLPVLGVPGWWDANASPGFYDDASVFRPGRRSR